MLKIGELFQGKYRVRRQLGAGSFGAVYLVSHERVPESELALKVITPPPAAALDYRRRFLQEVRIGCRLRSPHIVTVRDFDVTEDGLLYFTMDRVPGTPLDVVLEGVDSLPWRRAFAIARQILLALDEAHALGVIHRDVKPGNVLVEERADGTDFARVLDFGIARIAGGEALTGDWMGTPQYMAPEQCRTPGQIDGRVDLYACGVVLYELIVGFRPFRAQDSLEILLMHRNTPPVPAGTVRPEIELPSDVDAIIMRALEKRADDRYPTAAAMVAAIDAVLAGTTVSTSGTGASFGAVVDPLASLERHDDRPTRLLANSAPVPPTARAPADRASFVVGARTDRVYATGRMRISMHDPSAGPHAPARSFEVALARGDETALDADAAVGGPADATGRLVAAMAPVCELILYGGNICLRDTSARGIRIDGAPAPRGPLVFLGSRFLIEVPGTAIGLRGRVFARRPGDDEPGAVRLEPSSGRGTLAWVWLLSEATIGPEDGPFPLFDNDELGAVLRSEEGVVEVLASAEADRFRPLYMGDSVRIGEAVITA